MRVERDTLLSACTPGSPFSPTATTIPYNGSMSSKLKQEGISAYLPYRERMLRTRFVSSIGEKGLSR